MNEPGKCVKIAKEMKNNKLEILGIRTTKLAEAGPIKLSTAKPVYTLEIMARTGIIHVQEV